MLLVANLGEEEIRDAAAFLERSGLAALRDASRRVALCAVSAPIEAEMAELSPEDAQAFREDLALAEPGLDRVIRTTYELLGLISFLTAGEDECRAWTIRARARGRSVAAGTIHSDIERGFIRAEVVAFDDLVAAGSIAACRERGSLRLEGKRLRGEGRRRHRLPLQRLAAPRAHGELSVLPPSGGRRPRDVPLLRPPAAGSSGSTAAPGPAEAAATPEPTPSRRLVVLDLGDASPATLARALGVPPYEAGLLARRGGLHLHRILDPSAAEAEAARLGAEGLAAILVPEVEARVRPVRATAGERSEGALALRTEEGSLVVRDEDVLLIVRGPIARRVPPPLQETTGGDGDARGRLPGPPAPPRRGPPRRDRRRELRGRFRGDRLHPPRARRVGRLGRAGGSARRRLPAAAPGARARAAGAAGTAGRRRIPRPRRARGADGREDGVLLLDNVEQFRFYSGWRAAVERRR